MAWRLSRFQSFVSGTTTLTKAFVDALQDAIVDLFTGAYTVKKWKIDGTGDVANAGAAGSLSVSGNTAIGGDLNFTAAGGITGVSAVTATGNFETSGGNVIADSGQVRAEGTVSGSSGPGIVKGKRIYAQGTALVAGDFAVGANWGVGAAAGSILGDDTHGEVTITAAGAPAANPTVILTFKDGTYTVAPFGIAVLRTAQQAADQLITIQYAFSATALLITWNGTPTATKTYTFAWVTFGRS